MELDSPGRYSLVDRSGMLERVRETHLQLKDAVRLAGELSIPGEWAAAQQVLVLGMGGSAIGGDVVRSLCHGRLRVPMIVLRDYDLPGFVGERTLVIASSYSGNTEETLSATREALEAGAKVLAVTTGGQLARVARERGLPLLCFDYVAQPRAAFGYSVGLVLGILDRLGFVSLQELGLEEAISLAEAEMARLGPDVPTSANPAKELASMLHKRVAVVYGGGLMAEVARRWKGQFNENSKTWAFFEQFPELNHNAVMGYQFPSDLADRILVVMLDSPLNHPRVRLRYRITSELLAKREVPHVAVEAKGVTPLGQVISAVVYGDFVSYYLALLNGVDPTSIDAIDYLKERLAEQ